MLKRKPKNSQNPKKKNKKSDVRFKYEFHLILYSKTTFRKAFLQPNVPIMKFILNLLISWRSETNQI